MAEYDLSPLDPRRFMQRLKQRQEAIDGASPQMPEDKRVNRLAAALHPAQQHFVVKEVICHSDCCKSYILAARDGRCAFFAAGQYVSVRVPVGDVVYSRPYSISSSPKQSLEGILRITVKAVPKGIVSNHILTHWQVGTPVCTSGPMGCFTYEPLRDAEHIVGIAGGSGITPFLSLAQAIADGDEDCSLTLLYGCRRQEELIFRPQLEDLQRRCSRFRVVFFLSEQTVEGMEQGFIGAEAVRKYAPGQPYSVFACGPRQMYAYLETELPKLGLAPKYIRQELQGEPVRQETSSRTVKITVRRRGEERTLTCPANQTILRSLEQNGVAPPSRCRSGECGFCRSRLLSGRISIPDGLDYRRMADSSNGIIHPCCSFPLTDLVLEIYGD